MDDTKRLPQTSRDRVNELAIESYAHRELELESHIDELERELRWSNEAVKVAVELIRARTAERDRAREINRRLRAELTDLRDALVELEDRRAA